MYLFSFKMLKLVHAKLDSFEIAKFIHAINSRLKVHVLGTQYTAGVYLETSFGGGGGDMVDV